MTYPELALLIDGAFITGAGRKSEPVFNPATGRVLAQLPHASASDLEAALEAAQRGFAIWRAVSAAERGKIIKRAADLIRERIDTIAVAMTLEQGKPLAESRGEAAYAADVIEWYAEEGRRAYGRIVPSRVPGVRLMVEQEPVGVAVAFTPWNFPALTPARKIGGALAAGCALVLKPAEETPATAIELARAFVDAGLPKGVLNIVFGAPAEVSQHLIASPISRKVSFTGSVPIGRHLMQLSATHMKRTTMELGGHAPVVIFDDVDLEKTAAACVTAKYRNAGQVCIAPTRFYVQEKIYERFADRFAAGARSLVLGDGMDPTTQMGPMANARRVEAMETMVADARDQGATITAGGARRGNHGLFFEPTVIANAPDEALVMREEPFGPIAPIASFRDFDDVIARANGVPYGLAAYAFTTSNQRALDVGRALKAGMVGVNSFAVSHPETPFGGVKESGHGQEGGVEGLQAYFDVKLLSHG
ncbi:NAD-dependent succinate-semialdehyde dehydrogenase [Terricaulis silvestris]|nr:NAD-dependent succinate-semialdehyde dehydrogenase [Terricaulis silvestris]